jgi:hypothetical protein
MSSSDWPAAPSLPSYGADIARSTVSGLSSGAFMSVQLHLAHSATFCGAGIVAGGPYRCAESFPGISFNAEDACIQNALFICMNPLIPEAGPDAERLVALARATADDGRIDPVSHLAASRLYIFTGSEDKVVDSSVVRTTRQFYELLGVPPANIRFVDDVPAGHALLTVNAEDNPLPANQPPYINRWEGTRMQSWDILETLYGPLNPPAQRPQGRLLRFDQREFITVPERSSMSAYGYVYVPRSVEEGAECRIHVALHGCKQGYNFVDCVNGRPDRANDAPYGNRYFTTTGYNEIADTNDIVVLYPQAEGFDNLDVQNPEGCWDWWGYSADKVMQPDYYSRDAVQIATIHAMVERLASGGGSARQLARPRRGGAARALAVRDAAGEAA